ncbi:MAG: regulatory protein RecX [Negativicutes bacterium]
MKNGKMEGPLETAVRLLAHRDHTVMELRLKLQRRNFAAQEIGETIEKLQEKGYLDDEKIKIRSIQKMVMEKRHGVRGITGKLKQMGLEISSEQVREHFSEDNEWDIACQLLQKRFQTIDTDSFPRIARFLSNRGFSSAVLSRLADECRKHQ